MSSGPAKIRVTVIGAERPQLCLTEAELEDLVGSPFPALQMKWLDENRWPYVLNRRGRPRVARSVFDQRMGVSSAANDPGGHTSQPEWGPTRLIE